MYDYLLEKRLKKESPELHKQMQNNISVLQLMLESFFSWFPNFTDHSILHSMDVLYFCNNLLREQVDSLTVAECYALIMSCYLHDVGMGINQDDYNEFTQKLSDKGVLKIEADSDTANIIRKYHNEFSGLFIQKYAKLFDFLSKDMLFAIIQISRGHRKTDLYDEKEYPVLETEYGKIRTAYISAVLRLGDEIDVGSDRNPELLFDTSKLKMQVDIDAFGTHESIKTVELTENQIILYIKPKEPRFVPLIETLTQKIQSTLDYCRDVASQKSSLKITQKQVVIKNI